MVMQMNNRTGIYIRLSQMDDYMKKRFESESVESQRMILRDYAEEHNFTPSWFIQNFKHITKMTPLQYIVSLRLTNAMNLMDNTNYNINQIAAAVGYDNAHYFSRLFKKHTGIAPTEYKNRERS